MLCAGFAVCDYNACHNHWKECTVEDCGVEIEDTKAAHADANKDGKCDACAYAMSVPVTPEATTPKTGDTSSLLLWAALMLLGTCGIVATTATSKKKSVK